MSVAATTHRKHILPTPVGSRNENPRGIGLLALIAEDFYIHDRSVVEPGFWAVALHRLGNARMDVRPKVLRAPLTLAYRAAFHGINWLWGIDLSYTVKLGRRVRIWHHGCIVLNARSIGDDVHIRHSTTLGVARRAQDDAKPTIGNRVDIGTGACILGDVAIGDDCIIGANAVVLDSLPSRTTAVGVPARTLRPAATTLQLPVPARHPAALLLHPGKAARRAQHQRIILRQVT